MKTFDFTNGRRTLGHNIEHLTTGAREPRPFWNSRFRKLLGKDPDGVEFKFAGWSSPQPNVGDVLLFKCESQKVGRFLVVDIEHCMDPRDMWFAWVRLEVLTCPRCKATHDAGHAKECELPALIND